MQEIPYLEKKSGTALVLSGGATKAFYFHLGVLKVLGTDDVSSIVGTSAGSIIGAFLASGATVDNLLTSLYQKKVYLPRFDSWVKTLTSKMIFKPKYLDITMQTLQTSYAWLQFLATMPRYYNQDLIAEAMDKIVGSQTHMTGLFDAIALENLFKSILPSSDFKDLEYDLYVIATALDSNHRAVFNAHFNHQSCDDHFMSDVSIHKAVRASTAIPGLFEPVKINGQYYVDGEVKRTLSSDIGLSLADRIIISHTYQPVMLPQGQSVRDMGWVNIVRQSVVRVLSERIWRWRQDYDQNNPEKEILWIQPDPEDVEFFLAPEFSFRPEVQRKMIKAGEVAALKAIQDSKLQV